MRMLSVNLLGDSLIHADGQDELSVVFALLHLVLEPWFLLHLRVLELFGGNVIECESNFLIFVILIIVAVVEVGAFLRLNHLLHQFDCGIVFPAVFLPFRFYHNLL